MRIYYMSDAHLEFGQLNKPLPEPGPDDILLLAGDITVVQYLEPYRNDSKARSVKKATALLNQEIAEKFPGRAYAVCGNHESYDSIYAEAATALQDALPAVKVLDCDHVVLRNDLLLYGATLWSDMDAGNPLSMMAIRNGMQDFKLIKTPLGTDFTPGMAVEEFFRAKTYLERLAQNNRDKKIICHDTPLP